MTRTTLRRIPAYVFLSVAVVLSVFPLYFMTVSATNTSNEVIASKLLPGSHLLDNFKALVDSQPLGTAFYHSAVNAIATTLLALILCSIAGYAFEIYHSRAKDTVMGLLLLAIMIPFAATMIPLFRLFAQLGLVNSTIAVILPLIATPFLILLFRQASRTFPHEIIEAARLDGLGEVSIFARIYLPTMKPTLAAAGVITFLFSWNNFLWPKVILVDNAYQTLPMLLSNMRAGYVTDYGALMLAVFIVSVPTVVVFLLLQRSFAEGVTGAIK
ncbi:carbohydrate ABC transporter permease [Cellulomonas sp. P5_E12]